MAVIFLGSECAEGIYPVGACLDRFNVSWSKAVRTRQDIDITKTGGYSLVSDFLRDEYVALSPGESLVVVENGRRTRRYIVISVDAWDTPYVVFTSRDGEAPPIPVFAFPTPNTSAIRAAVANSPLYGIAFWLANWRDLGEEPQHLTVLANHPSVPNDAVDGTALVLCPSAYGIGVARVEGMGRRLMEGELYTVELPRGTCPARFIAWLKSAPCESARVALANSIRQANTARLSGERRDYALELGLTKLLEGAPRFDLLTDNALREILDAPDSALAFVIERSCNKEHCRRYVQTQYRLPTVSEKLLVDWPNGSLVFPERDGKECSNGFDHGYCYETPVTEELEIALRTLGHERPISIASAPEKCSVKA